MKILLVSPLPPPEGGIAIWTTQYLNYCKKNNIDVSIVNIAVTGKRSKKINDKRSVTDEIKRTLSIVSDLKKKLKSFRPEYVHINSACAKFGLIRDAACVFLAKRFNVKIILHFRCTVQDKLGDGKLRNNLFRKMVSKADLVLTLNTLSEKFVKNSVNSVQVVTVPNFIGVTEKLDTFNISDSVKNVIYVGHVQFDKGVREIFKTAEAFPSKHFILAGPVSKEVENLKHTENVELLGRVEHSKVLNLMRSSDVFLFPSYTEGFSNALVEAMLCGLPIIASEVGANADMLENKGGYLVPAENYKEIITAVNMIEDKSIRQNMSLWNQKKVFDKYRVDIVMEQLLSIYSQI